MYSKRVWLNEENSPSTGSVVAFDGFVRDDKEEWRSTFLELSDCYGKARLHKASYDSTEDFIEKMKLLRNEIDSFIDYLEKEDMEDLDKIKVRDYTKVKELNVMEEKKLNLKPFDIQKAREGKPVCTRDGRKVRIICFDRKFYYDGYNYPIVAMVNDNDNELVHAYTQDGLLVGNGECESDLMMPLKKKEGWAKVRKDINLYDTKEEADRKMIGNDEYVTAKVCWEE